MLPLIGVLGTGLWLYVLHVMQKAKLPAWRFFWGGAGLFILMMVFIRPVLTQPLAQGVSALAGFFGRATGTFTPYFKYGTIFVETPTGAMTLQIDMECSGILEIMAFMALLVFFDVYSFQEKILVSLLGIFYILVANAMRIILICEIIHMGGSGYYHMAHTYIGRIFFYVLSVLLYFYVFTKPQIVKMRVGTFKYD
ncbi:MAG: exosortase family protein XrtG [Lachnospiraceae bacterium]|nr:exosortase family protein XrtG [Lachnospiraceae bacterium]